MAGVHELPAFVLERIELTPGTVGDSTPSSEQYPAGLGSRDVDRSQPVSGRILARSATRLQGSVTADALRARKAQDFAVDAPLHTECADI